MHINEPIDQNSSHLDVDFFLQPKTILGSIFGGDQTFLLQCHLVGVCKLTNILRIVNIVDIDLQHRRSIGHRVVKAGHHLVVGVQALASCINLRHLWRYAIFLEHLLNLAR